MSYAASLIPQKPSNNNQALDIPVVVELGPDTIPCSQQTGANGLMPGSIIAERYCVICKLGEGGMGVVYACDDLLLGREVAIKFIQKGVAPDEQMAERLLSEARVAAQLRKHVAQVYDFGALPNGEPYIVMELLRGADLASVVRSHGKLAVSDVVHYVLQVCEGLREAHSRGIIHRDLKPENLFLTHEADGNSVVKILDFGISKQLRAPQSSALNPSESVGSPHYMSPEQILSPGDVDARTDIWSLGIVLFELLTGCLPFEQSIPHVCRAVLTQPVVPPSTLRRDLPPALEAIILRCLQKDKKLRFNSVDELMIALSTLSEEHKRFARLLLVPEPDLFGNVGFQPMAAE